MLILDEIGFVSFDHVGSEPRFILSTDRHEWRATVVATDLTIADRVTVFATANTKYLAQFRETLVALAANQLLRKPTNEG